MSRGSRAASQSSRYVGPGGLPDACASGPSHLRNRLDVLKVRGSQLAALAHNVVAELLSFVEVAHSSALDCGNMDEYVLSAIGRLNEAKTLLRIEELDCTLSHVWPPLKTPVGVYELHDIVQLRVRIQRCLGK